MQEQRIQAGIPLLRLFWIAFYDAPYGAPEAQAFPQFDPHTGEERLFKDIDQSRLQSIGWFPFPRELAERVRSHPTSTTFAVPTLLPIYILHHHAGQRVILLRRNFLQYSPVSGPTGRREIIYVLGWQETMRIWEAGRIQERNLKSFVYIHEDGRVVMTSDAEYGYASWQHTKPPER